MSRLIGRLNRRTLVALSVTFCITALVAGFLAGTAGDVPPAYAAVCQLTNYVCPLGDVTKTSAMTVNHHTSPAYLGTSTVVEPDDSETWAITASWATAPPAECYQFSETAYVTVTWNGSSWATSNITTTTNIIGISLCSGDTCDAGGGSVHAWQYKLIVNINDPVLVGIVPYNLRDVKYETTSVDDGYTVEDPTETYGDCYLDDSVSPTTQTNTAYDDPGLTWLGGRCSYDCDVSGATMTIYYD